MAKLPRGIRQRNGKFQVDVSHQGQRRSATCDTLDEAKAKQVELRHTLISGEGQTTAATTGAWQLRSAYQRTYETRWRDAKSGIHLDRNGRAVLRFFGERTRCDEVTTDWIDQWVETLAAEGNGDGTINRKLAALSRILKTAHERGGLPTGMPHLPRRKEGHHRIRYLSEQEEETLLHHARNFGFDPQVEQVWAVLIDTGLRVGELLKLEDRDVDLRQGAVTAWDTKNGTARTVPLTKRSRAIIEGRMGGGGKLFTVEYGHLRKRWDFVKNHMGLADDKQFVQHALRHTCASRLVQRGVPLQVVQQWLGHLSIQVTLRYAHLAPKNLFDAVGALEPQLQEAAE